MLHSSRHIFPLPACNSLVSRLTTQLLTYAAHAPHLPGAMNLDKLFLSTDQSADDLKEYYKRRYVPRMKTRTPVPRKKDPRKNLLRIASYNLHFHQPYGPRNNGKSSGKTFDRGIDSALRLLDPDIIVLEEVVELQRIVTARDYPYRAMLIPDKQSNIGNAILSKFPLHDIATKPFEQLPHLPKLEKRCFVSGVVEPAEGCRVKVIGTHLDVWDESGETRIAQFEEINEHMKQSSLNNVCCLGDFNALRRSDYTQAHWDWMVARDKRRNVTTVSNTMDYIIDDLKWRDSFEESPQFQGHPKKKNFVKPCVTSWPLRRIDFALLCPQFALKVANTMIAYEPTSDHLPIAIDIELPS